MHAAYLLQVQLAAEMPMSCFRSLSSMISPHRCPHHAAFLRFDQYLIRLLELHPTPIPLHCFEINRFPGRHESSCGGLHARGIDCVTLRAPAQPAHVVAVPGHTAAAEGSTDRAMMESHRELWFLKQSISTAIPAKAAAGTRYSSGSCGSSNMPPVL